MNQFIEMSSNIAEYPGITKASFERLLRIEVGSACVFRLRKKGRTSQYILPSYPYLGSENEHVIGEWEGRKGVLCINAVKYFKR